MAPVLTKTAATPQRGQSPQLRTHQVQRRVITTKRCKPHFKKQLPHQFASLETLLAYLVLKQSASKCPDTGKDKVDFVGFLGAVGRDIIRSQQTLQKSTNSLKKKKHHSFRAMFFFSNAGERSNKFLTNSSSFLREYVIFQNSVIC